MPKSSLERLMQQAYPPELPWGFAERVAACAMAQGRVSLWDAFLTLSPRVSLVCGAVAALLLVATLTGDGPGILNALSNYPITESLLPLP